MSALFIALAVGAGFLLGIRVGLVLGHKSAMKKRLASKRENSPRLG